MLGRPYGYAADHVRELEIVLADGSLVTASPAQHPDLFWAARGGKDNFGVVTAMVIDLMPVARLYGGGIYFPTEPAPTPDQGDLRPGEPLPDQPQHPTGLIQRLVHQSAGRSRVRRRVAEVRNLGRAQVLGQQFGQ